MPDTQDAAYQALHMSMVTDVPALGEMISVVDGEAARMASSVRATAEINGFINQAEMRKVVVMEYVLKRLTDYRDRRGKE